MYKCFCCGSEYEERVPNFCNECGASTQESQDLIDCEDAVSNYRILLAEHFFESQSELDIKYRVKLKISRSTHENIFSSFKAQKKALDSIGKFTVEFDENVVEAYAGNDTYLKFRFTNNSDEMLRVKFFWDDPETEDDFDLRVESKSFVKPGSSVVVGGSHVFSRIGIKEISDLYVTVLDPFQQVKFRASPLVFKVGNPDQKITQHFTTNNQISIEGRGVVDASGMGSDKSGPNLQTSNEPKWVLLGLTFIPKEPSFVQTTSNGAAGQTHAISSNVKDSGSSDSALSAGFDDKDIKSIQAAAANNNLAALNALGRAYYIGEGIEQDFSQAFEYFMKAAAQGYAASQNNVGQIYEFGNGVLINPTKAAEWYLKAAEQNHKIALFNAGRCYLNGIGVEQNEMKAKQVLEESIALGYGPANALLGDLYALGLAVIKDLRLAAEYYLKAALEGDDYGQLRLGNIYEEGDGVPADINLAIKWYTESANQGNMVAQYDLAKLYFTSETHQNEALCAKFAAQSANVGYAPSQTLLASLYRFGKGVPQDLDLAKQWLEKAIAGGDQAAASDLEDLEYVSFNSNHVDCDCPAIDEALGYLDTFLNSFDASVYGVNEETYKKYHRDYQVSYELEEVINSVIEQNTGWSSNEFHGILVDKVESIVCNEDGLILNFDGFISAIYKSGVASLYCQNNELRFNVSFDWSEREATEFNFWLEDGYVILGNTVRKINIDGGYWEVGTANASSFQETVNNANSWISRVFAVAKGDADSQQVLYPDDDKTISHEDLKDGPIELADGSIWYGALDSNGLLTGIGTWIWPNGDRFDGVCANGYLHGDGTYTWANGEYYKGGWFNGQQHGYGINIKPDGTQLEGTWSNGNFVSDPQKTGLVSSFVKGFKSGYESTTK